MSENKFLKIFNTLKENEEFSIINFAAMENGKFVDFQYFTIEKNGYFYYIENSYNNLIYSSSSLTITAFKKIDWNTKQQCRSSEPVKEMQDILYYVAETERLNFDIMKNTYKQKINHEFLTIKHHATMLSYLLQTGGFRELEVLKNIERAEMIQHDKKYKIVKLYNGDNSIDINLYDKTWGRLIVG